MAEKALAEVMIKDFSGMASNVDPTDLRPGLAVLQVNVKSIRKGELILRRGLQELSFDADDN